MSRSRHNDNQRLNRSVSQGRSGNQSHLLDGIGSVIKEVDESRLTTSPGGNVFDRLQGLAREIPEKQKGRQIAKLQSERVDEKTGQLLYRPKTGRAVMGRSEDIKGEGGISNYLYNKHKMKEEAKRR